MSVSNPFGKCSGYFLIPTLEATIPRRLLDFTPSDLKGATIEDDSHRGKLPIFATREEAFAECANRNRVAAATILDITNMEWTRQDYEGEKWYGVFELGEPDLICTASEFLDKYTLVTAGVGQMQLSAIFPFHHVEPTAEEREKFDANSREAVADSKAAMDRLVQEAKAKPSKAKRKTTAA